MLMPTDDGFTCKDCPYTTRDLFEYMEHCGVEYTWGIKLSKKFTFDLFDFLSYLNAMLEDDDIEGIREHVQSATLLMINASSDDLDNFVEEAVVSSHIDDIMDGVEEMLRNEDGQ